MPDNPNPNLLDRHRPSIEIRENFEDQLNLIEDIVNYGSNLVMRCLKTQRLDLVGIITIGSFLKHCVSMLDAIHVLVLNSAVFPANLQLRSLLESSLYMQWILKEQSEHRAKCFYVGELRKKREWYRRFQRGTKENRSYIPGFELRAEDHKERREIDDKDLKKDEIIITKNLNSDELKEINELYNINRNNRDYDFSWIKIAGANSIFFIAKELDRVREYRLIYNFGSEIMHASSSDDHYEHIGEMVFSKPIRSLENFDSLILSTIPTTLFTYQIILEHYRPGELPTFRNRYQREWRDPFKKMKKVFINPVIDIV